MKSDLPVDMGSSFRRAGERLRSIAKMNRWAKIQLEGKAGETDTDRNCYLLALPTELLLEIISHLSVLPEACLALTCKRLYSICGPTLGAKTLHFSRDFAPLFHHYRNGHNFVTPRWQFINLLEDNRWRACSRCLKLHPRSSFPARELKRKPEDRSCNLGSSAGIVDLCPCKKLTFHDKMELVELLKIREKSMNALAMQFGASIKQQRFCWHNCTENYGSTQLDIEIYPELDDEGQLKIKTEYRLRTGSGQLGREEHMTPRFGCAHRSVDLWLSSVCQTTLCRLYDSHCASCKRISICNTCNASLRCPRKQPSQMDEETGQAIYHFWTERCLGGSGPVPDQTWAAQRIHPAENLIDVANCSELCPWTIREHPALEEAPSLEMNILNPAIQDQSMNQLRAQRIDEHCLCPGAMSYPPPHNGPYPSQYMQQPPNLPHHQQTIHPQQLLYNGNVNTSASPYQYGKPLVYPQVMIPAYPAYAQTYNPQQQQQQQQQPPPPPPQHPQPQQQYVNPSDLFNPPPLTSTSPPQFTNSPSQYAAQPAVSVAGNSRSPVLPTSSTPAQSTYYAAPSPNQGNQTNNTYTPSTSTTPTVHVPPAAASPAPAPAAKPVAAKPVAAKPVAVKPVVAKPVVQTPPAPSPKPVQVLIPAPTPEVQQKAQRQPSKKQTQRHTGQKPTQKSTGSPIDYQVLLLAMADEYLNTAHSHGTLVALLRREMEMDEYYKLVATGLGCLEAVLKNWRLQPRVEALVRLRYARILFEETDNDLEAETALSKGIDLCERNRMLDLKYSMQHLLARMLYKTNPKASLKAVDGMIQDVEAYRHSAWEYAFRFLRVSLSLSSSAHQDSVSALQHLHKISTMASRNGDKAVSAMSAIIEALAHLQQGSGFDSIEQAQRAVAIARSHQLNDELRHIPQLTTLVQIVDICCSLLDYDINQSSQKLKVMQDLMDERLNDSNWRNDGSFSIPLNGKSAGPSSIDTGDILQVQSGTLLLSFNWLPQHDLYALCYFLSSITLSCKNSYDGRKAEKFLQEGTRSFKAPQEITESAVNANRRVQWRRTLYCNLLVQQVFLACGRTDWELASKTLRELRHEAQELGDQLPDTIECLMEYAAGAIAQATGDLSAALNAFQSPLLSLSTTFSKTARNDPRRDIAILAALNTVLILRDPTHPSHPHLPAILSMVESFCTGSPNKYIQAAYYLVCATVQTESTIQTKQYLQQALQSATAISNSQITCMTLTFMSWKYFRGVVGEQAEKSARAGRAMAKKANDRLWVSVTDEMLAETLERQGKNEEAKGVREEGHRVMMGLPSALKRPV
ncbi:hypothetical protein BO78DRAFT_403876 [Aspergillus sclerotiicarbonarius CBS 121057]|uniref:F-box domain-containing protein n=1 Tax=Aspergillus sclerotiicarbonarius (strain CBS 121057 / IBT 28362) TaxID=1448318 RepID=A0A319ETT4_ASPSB|nr:hypothetical protein BO78DRAFT_403876 [Aspergillus sclerotiicarbonarius CBS 121057]